ncbi:MAG: hypothetical protein SFW35_05155 [Chitinophagales bacterium]|nr:hypothetical protein [Chitinophagales bacterium]
MKTLKFILLIGLLPFQLFAENIDTATVKAGFESAKLHLENMLNGKDKMSYEEAIFQIENAWWGGGISKDSYSEALDEHTARIKDLIEKYKDSTYLDPARDLLETKGEKKLKYEKAITNYAIYRYVTTPSVWARGNRLIYHTGYEYSNKDPMGTLDWTNTQVTHLINENTGNCFALASLFKIISERLKSEAMLCTAPGHIYIRHKDAKGTAYNVELSNRSFPGTGTIETLTYTPTEATKSGITLRELDLKQSIALCLVYLAKGYEYKLGIKDNDFILSCAETALAYDSRNLNAMLLKSEVLETRLINLKTDLASIQKEKAFIEYQAWITKIFELGYREMPFEMKNLLIKGWTRDTIIQLASADHTPSRLKHPTLRDTRYAGLSWGLFDEEIRTKPLERYGNTVFDTRAKKIVAFLQDDILYNQYNFDPIVFAWSIDPLAHKFPHQSPYSAFGNNPIYNIDVGGAFQYPAKDAAAYTRDYPMITLYLAKHVQYDVKKSPIIQDAVTRNTYGGYSKQELIWKVAAWDKGPEISFVEGLAERTGAYGHTLDGNRIEIDAGFASAMNNILADKNASAKDKQAAMTSFFSTLLDETTHTGDLKNGSSRSAPEVGKDATLEIFRGEQMKVDGSTIWVDQLNDDDPTNRSDLSGTKIIVDRKIQQGKTEVLPTVPQQ